MYGCERWEIPLLACSEMHDPDEHVDCESMRAALLLLATPVLVALSTTATGLRVCKHTACKKAGSLETYDALLALASTSDEANARSAPGSTLSALQASFAASRVQAAGASATLFAPHHA
jgi:hypothetical protein